MSVPDDDHATAEELQERLLELEEQIRDKKRQLLEKRADIGDVELSLEQAEAAAAEAEREQAEAQERLRAAEADRASLLPQYERAQQNKDAHQRADQHKRDIEAAGEELRTADAKIKELEVQLQHSSSAYKSEREHRSMMVSRVGALVEELRQAVEHKVALTLPIDDAEGAPDAAVCLERIGVLTRERETEIASAARHARELAAMAEVKRARTVELQRESDAHIALLRAAKDEEISALVARFQEEREGMQRDIDDVKAANADQLALLRKTKLMSDKAFVVGDPRGDPHDANTAAPLSRRGLAAPAEKVLVDKSKDLTREKDELTEEIKRATAEKQRLIKASKELRQQIEIEEAKFASTLRGLDNQLRMERIEAEQLEKENQRLEELCEGLTEALRNATAAKEAAARDG